jgi:antitoxin component YwqK of YwqJK toxin-antitoxin module
MRKGVLSFLFLFSVRCLIAQVTFQGQVPHEKLYTFREVYDTNYGIQIYEKYNNNIGGDSVRKNLQGYVCAGWVEDHYTNGATLHKGFYADGQLHVYSNFYPNGQMEREFKFVTERKCTMRKYYPNGKVKSEVEYFEGNAIIWHDYWDNGQVQYIEEYDKKHERLLQRNSYYSDGKPEATFQPISDKKPIRYSKKEYYPNGQVKEEFEMVFDSDSLDFIKDGEDKQYDEKGTLTSDIVYVAGQADRTIK